MFQKFFEDLKAGKDTRSYLYRLNDKRLPALAKKVLDIIEREGKDGMVFVPRKPLYTVSFTLAFETSAYSFVQVDFKHVSCKRLFEVARQEQATLLCNHKDTENREFKKLVIYAFTPEAIKTFTYESY